MRRTDPRCSDSLPNTAWRLGFVLLLTLVLPACKQVGTASPALVSIVNFSLVDAATREPLPAYNPLRDGSTLNLATLPQKALNIRANPASEEVSSVVFDLSGARQLDNSAPFEVTPSSTGLPPVGSHQLSATAYPQANAKGVPATPSEVAFNVIDDKNASPDDPLGDGNVPTLLESYYVWDYTSAWQRSTREMVYRPRQFTEAPYEGWDVLNVPGDYFRGYTRSDWLSLTLNRPATIAVIWNGARPASWLGGWGEGAEVGGERTFIKVFPAGQIALGAIEGTENEAYTVLFAEADGTPSLAPTVPEGLETPQPNRMCPTWVHDRYMDQGFDGKMYRTWHPQIDPVYWCYFGHTHGSDPALFAAESPVTFNYYADKGHRVEPHEGFKVFVVNSADYSMRFTVHLGSSEGGRICARVHSYDLALADRRTGELLADLRLKSDFGIALAVDNGSSYYRIKDPGCPEMSALPETTGGRIRIPIAGTDGYESWSPSMPGDILGISNPPVLVIDNPITKVAVARNPDGSVSVDAQGNAPLLGVEDTGQTGERLWMSFPGANMNRGFSVKASEAAAQGEFYTDYRGQRLLTKSDPAAVRQYIKPGLDFLFINGTMVFTQDAWHGTYEFGEYELLRVDMNLENGLSSPN